MEQDKMEHPDCIHCGAKEITDDWDGYGTYKYACGQMISADNKLITACPKDPDWQ